MNCEAEIVNTLIEIRSGMNEMSANLKQFIRKATAKQASELSLTDQQAFVKMNLSIAELIRTLERNVDSQTDFDFVYEKVKAYTALMKTNLNAQETDEDRYIQPPTFFLMQELFTQLVRPPEYELKFQTKSTPNSTATKYYFDLVTACNELVSVAGETDQIITLDVTPIANIEVKNLLKGLLENTDVGEVMAETKAFADHYRTKIGEEPKCFPSIMVSGRKWQFIERVFHNGSATYLFFPILDTLSEDEGDRTINEENLKLVCRCILRFAGTMNVLVQKISKHLRVIANQVHKQDEGDDDGNVDDADNNDDYDFDDYNRDEKRSVQTRSKKRKFTHGSSSSSANAKKKTKTSNTQSNLTLLNMYRHEMFNRWQQPNNLWSVKDSLVGI